MSAVPDAVPSPQALVTEVREDSVDALGVTLKVVVEVAMFVLDWPSDNTTENGGVPVNVTVSVAVCPLCSVVLPLRVAEALAVILNTEVASP